MATIKRKQLKRVYKIPRSLKKSIKKNLVKVIKKRERKIREEERNKASNHDGYISVVEILHLIIALEETWKSHLTSEELKNELGALVEHGYYRVASELKRQQGGLEAQKEFARTKLETAGIKFEHMEGKIRAWLVEQVGDAVEVEESGREEENRKEDEEGILETAEEYDWTSTSTLE